MTVGVTLAIGSLEYAVFSRTQSHLFEGAIGIGLALPAAAKIFSLRMLVMPIRDARQAALLRLSACVQIVYAAFATMNTVLQLSIRHVPSQWDWLREATFGANCILIPFIIVFTVGAFRILRLGKSGGSSRF